MQRPGLVYHARQKRFYLYYDQGGITTGRNVSTYPDCQAAEIQNWCAASGFTVHVATSSDGINYLDIGSGLALNGTFGSAPGVKIINGHFVMFTDTDSQSLSMAVSADGLQFMLVQTSTNTSNGGRFKERTKELVTNITPITRGNALLGILAGSFGQGVMQPNGTFKCPGYQSGDFCIDQGYLNALFLQKKVEFVFSSPLGGNISLSLAVAYDEDRLLLLPPPGGWQGVGYGTLTMARRCSTAIRTSCLCAVTTTRYNWTDNRACETSEPVYPDGANLQLSMSSNLFNNDVWH